MLLIESLMQDQITASALVSMLQRDLGTAPTVQQFENAALAAYNPSQASSLGFKPFLDAHGNAMTETLASGMTASAFTDTSGHVVIAYQGTISTAQTQLDVAVLSGTDATKLQGFTDALGFASQVESVARSRNINQTHLFVTGHSLGGTLASFVASQTGLGGVAFASSGVPGYKAPPMPAANFVSYVEKGDPFANYATDAAEKGSAAVGNAHMDHYGTVVSLGSSADAAELGTFAASISGVSIGAAISGQTSVGASTLASLENQFYTLLGEHHGLGTYDADASAAIVPATAYGLQTTSMMQFMAAIATDGRALLADIPRILAAPSPTAAVDRFGADFPDLAREVTSMMHAQTFQAAVGALATVEPALYSALTTVRGMTAIVEALGHHATGPVPLHHAV